MHPGFQGRDFYGSLGSPGPFPPPFLISGQALPPGGQSMELNPLTLMCPAGVCNWSSIKLAQIPKSIHAPKGIRHLAYLKIWELMPGIFMLHL